MLKLIPISEEHTDFVLGLNNDPLYVKYFPRQNGLTREDHHKFLEKLKNSIDKYWVIRFNEENIGTVSLYDIDLKHRKAEWGRLIIVPKYSILAVSVAKIIIKEAFDSLGLHKLYCSTLTTNMGVLQLNRLLGFKEEGILKDHYFLNGEYVGLQYFSMINPKDIHVSK